MASGTIKNDMAWKTAGIVTGSTQVTLPDDFCELLVIPDFLLDNSFDFSFSISIPKQDVTGNRRFYTGYGYNNTTTFVAVITDSTGKKIQLQSFYVDGNNRLSGAKLKVYYR